MMEAMQRVHGALEQLNAESNPYAGPGPDTCYVKDMLCFFWSAHANGQGGLVGLYINTIECFTVRCKMLIYAVYKLTQSLVGR